jgi:hypothetical protein
MSRVAVRHTRAERAVDAAERLVDQASGLRSARLPWIDADSETRDFIAYWFAARQRGQLRRLGGLLLGKRGPIADVLRVGLSRTIITKDSGASLARDVSHSRPHRVTDSNSYDVYAGFLTAVRRVAELVDRPVAGSASVKLGDARRLPRALDGSVDLVITSPPYLNAIDYMRGHRLSLVWLGYQLSALRSVRSSAVGAERAPDSLDTASVAPRYKALTPRQQSMLNRYAQDMCVFMGEIARKLRPKGEAIIIVGDCTIRGAYVRNSVVVARAAERAGLKLVDRKSRRLPADSRYLPPPSGGTGPLSKRMKSEIVLRLAKT